MVRRVFSALRAKSRMKPLDIAWRNIRQAPRAPRTRDGAGEVVFIVRNRPRPFMDARIYEQIAVCQFAESNLSLLGKMCFVRVFAARDRGTGFHRLLPGHRNCQIGPRSNCQPPRSSLDACFEDEALGAARRDAHAESAHHVIADESLFFARFW